MATRVGDRELTDQEGTGSALPTQAPAPRPQRVATRVVAPTLVGRAAELDLMLTAVAAPPAVVTLEGEAGIGKSRLVTELLARASKSGRRVLVGRCHGIREPFPLGPVLDAVRALADELSAMPLSPVAGALRPLLPELAEGLPEAPAPLGDPAAERHRVFRALAEVLAAVGPATVVLEDLHWADEQTAEFLAFLLAAQPPGLSLVLTYRGDEASEAVRAVAARLPAATTAARVALTGLDTDEVAALTAAILDTDHVSREFAELLRERTDGLPFALEEVLALLRERGDLIRKDGRWSRRVLADLGVPGGIRDSVLERAARLGRDGRAALEASAVLQVPVPLATLVATCRVPPGRAREGIEEALASGLLAEAGETVGFRHLLAAQAEYEAIPRPRRQDLHARAVVALEALDPVPFGQVAHHLRHADRPEEWVAAAERAADAAVELGNDAEAVRLLEDVLSHAPAAAVQPGRLAVKLARSANELAPPPAATIELLSEVLQRQLPQVIRGELRFRLALLVEGTGGDLDLRRRLLLEAVDDLDERPDLQARAMMALGIPRPPIALSEHIRWLQRSLATLPAVADRDFRVLLLGKIAMVLVSIGDSAWRTLTGQMQDETDGLARTRRAIEAYESVGMAACYAGHHEIASELLGAALEGAAACDSPRQELHIRSALALLDYCRGAWDGLAARTTPLLDEVADMPPARVDVEVAAGCLALAHGDVDAARLTLSNVVEAGFPQTLPFAVGAIARLNIVEGAPDEAVTHVDRLVSGLEWHGWVPVVQALPVCVQALLAAGRKTDALALVERCEREVTDLDLPLAPAAVRHARGFLEEAEQQSSCAAEHFLAAADSYEALHCPYEAAQAREQAALSLSAAGGTQAEREFRTALAAYQGLGATWDAARCAQAARAHGVRVPTLHRGGRRGYGTALSPRERQVAELATQGRTNKEIAAELFLSPATVSSHLARAMRKLEVRSRREVAARLADGLRTR